MELHEHAMPLSTYRRLHRLPDIQSISLLREDASASASTSVSAGRLIGETAAPGWENDEEESIAVDVSDAARPAVGEGRAGVIMLSSSVRAAGARLPSPPRPAPTMTMSAPQIRRSVICEGSAAELAVCGSGRKGYRVNEVANHRQKATSSPVSREPRRSLGLLAG